MFGKLDPSKPMKTREGKEVRIICTDGPGVQKIVGVLEGSIVTWSEDGHYWHSKEDGVRDLVNVPEEIEKYELVLMHSNGDVFIRLYDTQSKANEHLKIKYVKYRVLAQGWRVFKKDLS